MASNSKLDKFQKQDLLDFKQGLGKNSAFGVWGDTTVFVKRVSRDFAQVSASFASPDEKKFRPKVGEWHAMTRFEIGEFALMKFDHDCTSVQAFADTVAYKMA